MKILTEKEQLQNKQQELYQIRMDILTERELILKLKRKEIDKLNSIFSKVNWLRVHEYDERIKKLVNAEHAISEYRNHIIDFLEETHE
jgi:hypothetical protein